jgi:hypothetical protein
MLKTIPKSIEILNSLLLFHDDLGLFAQALVVSRIIRGF